MSKSNAKEEYTFNRRWTLFLGVLFILMGFVNVTVLLIGVLTLIIGLFLFFSDSWIIYLIIALLWVFGGILSLSTAYISDWSSMVGSGFLILFGIASIIGIARYRKSKVKGYLD